MVLSCLMLVCVFDVFCPGCHPVLAHPGLLAGGLRSTCTPSGRYMGSPVALLGRSFLCHRVVALFGVGLVVHWPTWRHSHLRRPRALQGR